MSTRVGTLRTPRAGQAFWVPALLTLLVVAAFTAAAIVIGADEGREDAGTATVERTLVNTPSELHGGVAATTAGGTYAVTPNEQLSGGRRIVASASTLSGTLANTPTELRGGMSVAEPYEPIVVNDQVCGQCR